MEIKCETCKYESYSKDDGPCADCGDGLNWESKPTPAKTEIAESGANTEIPVNSVYRENVVDLIDRQMQKGYAKYGVLLECNKTLTMRQRLEHLQEELIDGLMYCEHIKSISDDGITANDYQRAALRTAGDDESQLLLNGVMGLCGEAGEVIDAVKKTQFQGHALDKEHIAEELGDVAWYLAVAAAGIGYDLDEILRMNVDKLKRRYPLGFDKERSINR